MTEPVPLSVWLTGQQPSRVQRAGRYVPASVAHPGKMLPAIAAHAITAYTEPGDVVLDPMCGIGTSLIEAVHLGRDAVGVEYEPPWAQLARRNLHHARAQGATGHGTVHQGDARRIGELLEPELHGRVALILTSPPYGASLHGQVTARPGTGVAKRDYRYSRDPANLAHVGLDRLLDAMVDILTGCQPFLKSGGIVAMTVRPYWEKGVMVDLPGPAHHPPSATAPDSRCWTATSPCWPHYVRSGSSPGPRSSNSPTSAKPAPPASPATSSPTRISSSS